MNIREVQPRVDRDSVLAGGQFADALRVSIADADLAAIMPFHRPIARTMLRQVCLSPVPR